MQRAHQFWERKSFNRKSREVEEPPLIYYVERGAMSRPVNGKGNFDLSVVKFRVSNAERKISSPSRKRAKLVSALCYDLRNPASTQMIDGTEKPKIPSKFAKRASYSNTFLGLTTMFDPIFESFLLFIIVSNISL